MSEAPPLELPFSLPSHQAQARMQVRPGVTLTDKLTWGPWVCTFRDITHVIVLLRLSTGWHGCPSQGLLFQAPFARPTACPK